MARIRQKDLPFIGCLIVAGAVFWLISTFVEAFGIIKPLIVLGVLSAVAIVISMANASARRSRLMAKYGDAAVVDQIIARKIWEGETADQIIESLGKPVATDVKHLKTKKKEIWKYTHKGGNRYGLRITLDNDVVVGWEQRK